MRENSPKANTHITQIKCLLGIPIGAFTQPGTNIPIFSYIVVLSKFKDGTASRRVHEEYVNGSRKQLESHAYCIDSNIGPQKS